MAGKQIKLIISDFDGTLVNTFQANFLAYEKAFSEFGYSLTESSYRSAFGLRYDDFMDLEKIENSDRSKIRQRKSVYYPEFFDTLKINETLVRFINFSKETGIKTALASTATKTNLMRAIDYLKIRELFDVILTGEDTSKGKPNPEIYLKTLDLCKNSADEAIIFEDSDVGCEAAKNAGVNYIKVGENWYEN